MTENKLTVTELIRYLGIGEHIKIMYDGFPVFLYDGYVKNIRDAYDRDYISDKVYNEKVRSIHSNGDEGILIIL